MRTKWTKGGALGRIANVSFKNINIHKESELKGVIRGDSRESMVSGISFEGIRFDGKRLYSLKDARINVNGNSEDIVLRP